LSINLSHELSNSILAYYQGRSLLKKLCPEYLSPAGLASAMQIATKDVSKLVPCIEGEFSLPRYYVSYCVLLHSAKGYSCEELPGSPAYWQYVQDPEILETTSC